jgi:hypothetical protein
MKQVTFTIRFFGGGGGFYIFGESIPQDTQISSEGGDIQHMSVMQTPGFKVVTITGVGPAEGRVEIQVTDATAGVLSPFERNSYPTGPFMGSIFYEVN